MLFSFKCQISGESSQLTIDFFCIHCTYTNFGFCLDWVGPIKSFRKSFQAQTPETWGQLCD